MNNFQITYHIKISVNSFFKINCFQKQDELLFTMYKQHITTYFLCTHIYCTYSCYRCCEQVVFLFSLCKKVWMQLCNMQTSSLDDPSRSIACSVLNLQNVTVDPEIGYTFLCVCMCVKLHLYREGIGKYMRKLILVHHSWFAFI